MATMDVTEREKDVLEAYLAGHTSPRAIAEEVFLSSDAEVIEAIKRLIRTVGFTTNVMRAREDLVGTALDSLKRTVMRNIEVMKDLATNAQDPRVRFQANKDILDRVGLAPTQKTDFRYNLKDYENILEGLKKKDEPRETDSGSDGVVQEAESPTEDRSEGS